MAVVEISVNFPWAIRLARVDAAAVAALRLAGAIEVAEDAEWLWLRGQGSDEKLDAKLAALPACDRYEWLATNQLRRMDLRIPSARFPELSWQTLDAWLRVEVPSAAIPGELSRAIPLRLVRSTEERESELLLTRLEDLKEFAANAARVRLDPLQFAVSLEGHALVRGRPLPPLPGRRYVVHSGVAVPAGFSWEPAVGPDVLARRFGVSGDALVLWNEDGTFTRLHVEQFVALSRSAIGASSEALVES